MEGKKVIAKFLSSTIYFKVLWAILVILKLNPFISRKTSPLFYFLIIYGAAIILYDFFTDKKALKDKYIVPILLFFTFMGLSTIVNCHKDLISNLKIFITTVVQFMVIGRVDLKRSREDVIDEMRIVNNTIIIGVTIVSLISLYLLVFGINGFYKVMSDGEVMEELIYYYGVAYGGRLIGVFANPNCVGAFCAIAVLCSIINLGLFSNELITKIGYYISIAINFFCIILSGSRGTLLPFYICIFVLSFLTLMYRFKDKKHVVLKYFKIILISGICVMLVYGSVKVIGNYAMKIPAFFGEGTGEVVLNLDRIQLLDDDIGLVKNSSGRKTIWKAGINTAKMKPIFGVGKARLHEIVIKNWKGGKISSGIKRGSLHNIYLETLVAYGLPTLISLVLLLCLIYTDYMKKMICIRLNNKNQYFFGVFVIIMLVFIMGNNMFESKMLYYSNLESFVFSLYLGYIMYFTQYDSSKAGENIIYRGCQRLTDSIVSFHEHKNTKI
jgi:O-antigen ligase